MNPEANAIGPAGSAPSRIVGLGGTARQGSSTGLALAAALEFAAEAGAETTMLGAADLALPLYEPGSPDRTAAAIRLVEEVRAADAVIVATPGYHGGISGLVKNALDYLEDLRDDERPYLHDRAVGCIVCAYGWQASITTLQSLRATVHALRGWPTPLGVALNSADPIFTDGRLTDAAARQRLRELAAQVVGFSRSKG